MKKLINLIAFVMLVSTNVFTPFSYAQVDTTEVIPENGVETVEESLGNTEQDLSDDIVQILENEGYENSSQLLGTDIQGSNTSEEIDEELTKIQNLNIAEIDLNNPIHLYRDGELTGTYTGLSQAINEAESGDIIKLIDDISVSDASVVSGKTLTINGNNHTIIRGADITTITVNEDSSLTLQNIIITDNAINFAPNRYDSLLRAVYSISLCLGGVNETKNESGDVIASACLTENVDVPKTHPQIYSVGDIYGDNLTILNSLNSKGSAAIIVEKGGIEMINSSFIHNGASGGGRGGAIRVGPNDATNIVDKSPITKIVFSGCYFESNYSCTYGGALSFHYTPEVITIDNCVFSGNTASNHGGAMHIPTIHKGAGGGLPQVPTSSLMPVGTIYINNSDFYNNWVGNDGAAIENDDLNLKINSSNFEHNYGMQPTGTSVGVIGCQPGGAGDMDQYSRSFVWRKYNIKNSIFKDSNVVVFGDHNMVGSFVIDNCLFENQNYVLLTRNGVGEIKNSTIVNSNPGKHCGTKGYSMYDFMVTISTDYSRRKDYYGVSNFKLYNNTYSNDCNLNQYAQIYTQSNSTGVSNITIENEIDTKVLMHRRYYDSIEIQGTDEIYYGATIDDGKYAYIKKDKLYDFDEFNTELVTFSNGYQLESGKAMLFYLDSGYTELWSGSIHTTTNLYGKETDIHNITYEGMDGINFEGITHTYKFINLDHTQYLTELTPYTLNTPSRNGYRFEGRFLDSGYTLPITTIEARTTGDIILYAKRTKTENKGYSGGGGGGGGTTKPDTPKEEQKPADTPEQVPQNDNSASSGANVKTPENDTQIGSQVGEQSSSEQSEGQGNGRSNTSDNSYTNEQKEAYAFAKENGITTMATIQKADMSGKLTRIQMAKMLSQYAINVLGQTPDTSKTIKFRDVTSKKDADYDNGVTLAYQLGIMGQNMPNNRFRPNDEVSRAEFVSAFSRMLYNTSDGEYRSTSKYYIHHMEKLEAEGIVTNTDPKMKEKRGYVMIMLMRSAK